MKKRFLKEAAAVAVLLCSAVAVFPSCNKDKGNEGNSEVIEENVELPETDQLDVTTDIKSVVLGSGSSAFSSSLVNRLKNRAGEISADAGIIVFAPDYTISFTLEQAKKLLQAYAGGAGFVFLNPTCPEMSGLEQMVSDAVTEIIQSDKDFDENVGVDFTDMVENIIGFYGSSFGKVECVAFRGTSIYLVRDLDEMGDKSWANSVMDFEGETESGEKESGEASCAVKDYTPNGYDMGKSADLLVEWLNDGGEANRSVFNAAAFGLKSEESAAIDKYMTGQRVSIQHKVGPSRALGRTLVYEMVYTVYSAYDFDKNEDYYFIRLEPDFHCSALGCQNGRASWVDAVKEVTFDDGSKSGHWYSLRTNYWYGPYMSGFDYTAKIVQEDGTAVTAELLQTTPNTDVSGSDGYTIGMQYALNGNFGFNSGGITGGVTAGFSFTDYRTQSVNSLRMTNKKNNNIPHWTVSGIVPKFHPGWDPYHDEVATFQKTDWQTELTWIVRISNPQKDKPYYIKAEEITEITELNKSYYDLELRVHPTQSAMIKLCPPNRGKLDFLMACSDKALWDEVSKQFDKSWQNEFTYYADNEAAAVTGAKSIFEKVKTIVKGDVVTLKEHGFTGNYTFRLIKAGDENAVATFTLKNGVVE